MRLATNIGSAAMPRRGERRGQRVDRRGVGGEQHGAVEEDRHDRPRRVAGGDRVVQLDDALAGQIEPGPRDGRGLCRGSRTAGERRQAAEQAAHVLGPAFAEEGEQAVELVARQRRGFDQALVDRPALAGQKRQRDALFARQRRQPVAAVAPPVVAAEEAHQDDLGMGGDAVDPEIDRHRMPEIGERGEPHRQARRRRRRARRRPGRRDRCRKRRAPPGPQAAGAGRRARRDRRSRRRWWPGCARRRLSLAG